MTTAFTDATVFAPSPRVVARKLFGEIVLVPVSRSAGEIESLYTLEESGTFIWETIDGVHSVAEIRDLLVQEFDVGVERAGTDLRTLLAQLQDVGAIDVVPA